MRGYRRYVGKQLVGGERSIYHRAAYKCNSGTSRKMHACENITPCRNPQVATHLLEDAVFEIIQEHMLDPVKLRQCMEALKSDGEQDQEKVAQGLMAIARKIQAAEEGKRKLIDLYASGHLAEAAYVDANISLDQELHELRSKKAEFVGGLPLLHTESIEPSIWQFCGSARVRFERCANFDDKRQFLVEHVERVIYDRYRVTVVGSVPIKMQFGNSQEIETRKIAFCLPGEIDKSTLHKMKPHKKLAEDGRMNAFGGKEPVVSVPIPMHSLSSLT